MPGCGVVTMTNPLSASIFTLTVSAPPSANACFSNVPGKGRIRTRAYSEWLSAGVGAINAEKYAMGGVSMPDCSVVVAIQVDRPRADRDIDNCIKPIVDLLVKGRVIKDDNLVSAVIACWADKSPDPRARVVVYPSGETPFINFKPSKPGSVTGHLQFRR